MNNKIRIKYFDEDIKKLKKISKGDWIDLRSRETIEYEKDTHFKIPVGIAMELPENYEALVAPRGSTFKNFSIIITNSPGVIDSSFSGDDDEWNIMAYSLRTGRIEKNDRIAQFRIIENMPEFEFDVVESLNNDNRGGFGSTGVK